MRTRLVSSCAIVIGLLGFPRMGVVVVGPGGRPWVGGAGSIGPAGSSGSAGVRECPPGRREIRQRLQRQARVGAEILDALGHETVRHDGRDLRQPPSSGMRG